MTRTPKFPQGQPSRLEGLMVDAMAMRADGKVSTSNLVNAIGRNIISGIYPEGELLPNEAAMLAKYEVSRTALREAYSKLTAKGLLSARPRVGTSVRSRDNWNILDPDVLDWHLQSVPASEFARDLYSLRRMIEPSAAGLSAEFHTEDDIQKIMSALAQMRSHSAEESLLVEADFQFHLAILAATKNPFINAFSALIRAAMISTFQLSWRGAEVHKQQRLDQHAAVAEAIRARDSQRAKLLMEALLEESYQDINEALG